MGYPYDSRMLDLGREAQHAIGGNKIRFPAIGSVREELSWREHLSRDDVWLIDSLTVDLARRLGCEPAGAIAAWGSEPTT